MENKYRLVKTSIDDKWDDFVKQSPSGTMFASSLYLKALNVNIDAYYCFKKNELMAAVLCLISKDGACVKGHDYVIYDGLMYRDLSYLNRSQRYSEESKIQECVANEICNMYTRVSFKLHPSIVDIREFLWVNYHSIKDGYLLDLRYTCYVNISDFSINKELDELETYNNASSARRQEIRYAIKKGVKTTLSTDVSMFINLYQMTFDRQDNKVCADLLEDMGGLLESLIENDSCLMLKSSVADDKVGSMAVFTLDQGVAYYLFGANDPSLRNQHTGTAIIWDAFYFLAKKGVERVDLEGVNSPKRGWFKASFGGEILQYYKVFKKI
jgi:hypothetical protein